MFLDLGDAAIQIAVRQQDSSVSKHTGRDLGRIEAVARVDDDRLHAKLMRAIQEQTGVVVAERSDEKLDRRWRVKSPTWSSTESSGRTLYSYELLLHEVEDFSLERLQIGSFECEPIRYKEQFEADFLGVEAIVKVAGEEREALLGLLLGDEEYHPVIRHGISDTPIEMRFGLTHSSEHDDGTKYHLILVEKAKDEASDNPGRGLTAIFARHEGRLVYNGALIDLLLDRLTDAGVLGEDDVASLKEQAREELPERHLKFNREDDVERSWYDE